VSEIMPRAGGKNAIPTLHSFIYTRGSDCGCCAVFELRKTTGPALAVANYEYPKFEFSPDGRFIAGFRYGKVASWVWIADLKTGRKLWQKALPPKAQFDSSVRWSGAQLSIPYGRHKPSGDWISMGKLVWKAK
jgi:hypothetical protein